MGNSKAGKKKSKNTNTKIDTKKSDNKKSDNKTHSVINKIDNAAKTTGIKHTSTKNVDTKDTKEKEIKEKDTKEKDATKLKQDLHDIVMDDGLDNDAQYAKINKDMKEGMDEFINLAKKTVNSTIRNKTRAISSKVAKKIEENMNEFADSARKTINSAMPNQLGDNNYAKKMIQNLTDNLNNSFKHNLNLSQESLKCRNATDFIDIQRRFFEHNYQITVKVYTDFIHDMQQVFSSGMNKSKNSYLGN